METPSSSIRRITRSQTIAAPAVLNSANSSAIQKIEESKQRVTKQQDRSALIDITNDSPIVGLAMGKLETPSSLMSKKMVSSNQGKQQQDMTPGSGEALLRCQVKTLLQKVEEEAEISKISSVVPIKPLLLHLGSQFLISPNGLLAPTPANTPQIFGNPSDNNIGLASIQESKSENEISPPQAESEKELMVTRSLMLEFSEKSEGSYSSEGSSVVTYQVGEESQGKDKSCTEDDSSSIWSVQVNASSTKDDHETDVDEIEDETTDVEEDYYFDEETGQENDAGVDDLCDAISKINVNGNGQAKFCGKHTKFVYNSDDELEEEEVVSSGDGLRLQGWPTPKGKHIRFPEESLDE